jgi:hypothetical protein
MFCNFIHPHHQSNTIVGFVRDGIRSLPDVLKSKYPSDFPAISKAELIAVMHKCADLVTAFFCSAMAPPIEGDCIGSAKPCRDFCTRVVELCPGILHAGELIGKEGIYRELFFSKAEENKIYYDLVDMAIGTITAQCPASSDLFWGNETMHGCIHPGDSDLIHYESSIPGVCNVDLRKSIIKDNEYKTSQWKSLLSTYNELTTWFFGVTYWMPIMTIGLNSMLIVLSGLVEHLCRTTRAKNNRGGSLMIMIDTSIVTWIKSKWFLLLIKWFLLLYIMYIYSSNYYSCSSNPFYSGFYPACYPRHAPLGSSSCWIRGILCVSNNSSLDVNSGTPVYYQHIDAIRCH